VVDEQHVVAARHAVDAVRAAAANTHYTLESSVTETTSRPGPPTNMSLMSRETPNTIRLAKAVLAAMLADAAQSGDIPANAVAGCRYGPSSEAKRRHPKRKRRALTAADMAAILTAVPERWRAFFAVLAQTGLRVGELLGLTWQHVHLGDDPHIMVAEQVYKGERKELKTEMSTARVRLSPTMAAWLAQLGAGDPDAPCSRRRQGPRSATARSTAASSGQR
jgi:integrase